MLQFTRDIGGAVGVIFATRVAEYAGWRVAMYAAAATSALLGLATVIVGVEPRHAALSAEERGISAALSQMGALLRIRTFQYMLGQGATGTAPWRAWK